MSDNSDIDSVADYLKDVMERDGASCTSVKDGHVILIKRNVIEELLENTSGDSIAIFIKKPNLDSN